VLAPDFNVAARSLLERQGYEVVVAHGAGCCGALVQHMGQEAAARAQAQRSIDAWWPLIAAGNVEAIVTTASGCGTTLKDYGSLFAHDPAQRVRAETVAALSRDISELVDPERLAGQGRDHVGVRVAYQSACSLQHGQKLHARPAALLRAAGFEVTQPRDAHLCCGSAGVYNVLQPAIAGELRERRLATLRELGIDCVASGNLGCVSQLAEGLSVPMVHTVELLDWATGGPRPPGLVTPSKGAAT
jgi:glycolate oxidase iron-sulfur subunit